MTNKAIVSYVGGYGGDIFTTLLLSNFEDGVNPTPITDQSVGEFLNRYSSPTDFCKCGRGIDDFFSLILNIDNQSIEYTYLKEYFKDDLLNVYDADDDKLIENFVHYCRSYLYIDQSKPFIIPTHYTSKLDDRFAKFDIENILPNSVKIRLNSYPEHVPLFRGLAKFKNKMPTKYSLSELVVLFETIEYDTATETDNYVERLSTPLSRFIDINISEVWLQGGSSIDYLQTILTDMFDTPIKMDKSFIEKIYNPNNKTILTSIFGSSFLDNSYETNKAHLVNYVTDSFRQVINA